MVSRLLQPVASRLPRTVVDSAKHRLACTISWNLDALGILWGTDKARGHHGYTRYYSRHLQARRRAIKCVLEVGVGGGPDTSSGGNSLRMWRNYFPRATIYGLDIHEKHLADDRRLVALQADQADVQSLRHAIELCPPFDLVIDDGSHVGTHIITSFETLFPAIRPGGLYAIEDLETAYLPTYGGGPPGTPATAAALTKSLLDDLNLGRRPVAAIHAYPGLVLIEKAPV